MATLGRIAHEKFTDDALGALLEKPEQRCRLLPDAVDCDGERVPLSGLPATAGPLPRSRR